MNCVTLIGRLTKDPELRYTQGTQPMAVATFTLAIDRITKQGEEKKADFPRITVFGKQAENCKSYLFKGMRAGVEGRIQTGSYQDKNTGQTVYTTDVIANRVEFLEKREQQPQGYPQGYQAGTMGVYTTPAVVQQPQYQQPQVPQQGYAQPQQAQAMQQAPTPQQMQMQMPQQAPMQAPVQQPLPEGRPDSFQAIEEDVPF